jgi:hypothetical protein
MPKYKVESNAGAIRHLLGGNGSPRSDIRASHIQWAVGLRSYNSKSEARVNN